MILSKKEIAYLAGKAEAFAEQNALSLFSSINEEPDGTEYASLVEKGIIGDDGYDPGALEHLLAVAKPQRCSRLLLNNVFFKIEKYTYKTKDRLILVEADAKGLNFSQPASLTDMTLSLSAFVGLSPITNTAFKLNLAPDEGLLLTAVMDIYRRNELAAYLGEQKTFLPLSKAEIKKEIGEGPKIGLLSILNETYSFVSPKDDAVQAALESLVKKECLREDGGYVLSGMLGMFARNYLIPDCFVAFDTFSIFADGEIGYVGNICVAAGMHNLVLFSYDGTTLEMSTVSSANLLKNIEAFMLCPELERNEMATTLPAAAKSSASGRPETSSSTQQTSGLGTASAPIKDIKESTPGSTTPTAQHWYLRQGGEQYGPYNWEQFNAFVHENRIGPDDLVWHDRLDQWTRADSIPGLFN